MNRDYSGTGDRETRWLAMSLQYNELDRRIDEFAQQCGASCPWGCGTCCTADYEPEVTTVEAEFAARWIIDQRPDLEQRFDGIADREYCIFYDQENPFHCMIYAARPIICRGFGFSGYRDKHGSFVYRPCRHMTLTPVSSSCSEGPLLPDYQVQYTLEYREVQPISEAIFSAWQKLKYYDSLSGGDDQDEAS